MRKIATIVIVLMPYILFSQSSRWKRYRYEAFYGIGVSNFLGELGGSDKMGAKYFSDLNMSKTRPSFDGGFRYLVTRTVTTQVAASWGWIGGDDSKTNQEYRNNRNLKFRSIIVELSLRGEYALYTERKRHRYSLRKVKGVKSAFSYVGVFAGIAGFYFNPKGKDTRSDGAGQWVSLHDIGTEGQNFLPTRSPYKRTSISFPIGMLVKYNINTKWSIGVELGVRPTMTDYIDDVSSTYVDPELVAKYNKTDITEELANYLADPSKWRAAGNASYTAPLQQRGNSNNNDTYMFGFVNLYYKLKTNRKGWPVFKL